MYANTCWGLLGLAVTFGLAVIGLTPEYAWLRSWFWGGSAFFLVASILCFCWPLLVRPIRFARSKKKPPSITATLDTAAMTIDDYDVVCSIKVENTTGQHLQDKCLVHLSGSFDSTTPGEF